MALTDLGRQWLNLTVEHNCRTQLCHSTNSWRPNQRGFKTMQRILDSVGLPLADILGLLNDVRWPAESGELRRGPHSPQEAVDFRDPKKTPKQACRRVCKQENTQRKAPGSSARSLQGPRDTLRLRVVLPILTHSVSLFSDVLRACHWLYPSSCQLVYSKYLKLVSLFAQWNFLYENYGI